MKEKSKLARQCLVCSHDLTLAAACALILGLLARPVAAQYDPPRDVPKDAPTGTMGIPFEEARRATVGVSASYDSNFFRDPGLVRDPQSETITTGYAGLLIDKLYAQQRFFLSATATAYRYNENSYLDFNGFDYRAAWYWSLTPRISGTLSADRTETPTQFEDTLNRQSDVTTTENYIFNLAGRLFGGWHLLLGVSQVDQTSEQTAVQGQPDYRETRREAGIRYLLQTGSSVDALWRRVDGDQDSQVINNAIVVSNADYREDQSELRATWIISPKSRLNGRATYLDRRYDQAPESDFSGTEGELDLSWSPTSTLDIRISAMRNIEPWQSLLSDYRVSDTYSIMPTWRATTKTSVYLNLRRTYDDYPATSTAVPARNDTTDYAAIGLSWLAMRNLSIDASVQYAQRSSNDPLVEYDDTIGRLSVSLKF